MSKNRPVPSQELPQCQVCKLDPVPQSTQHIILLILEVALIFVNWKFSIILLMLGYSFPLTNWKCPYCSRNIDVNKQNNPSDSIFLRVGKCMALFSLNKFRVFAAAIIVWMLYLFINEPAHDPRKHVTKTWQSMVNACGYEVYMENSVRANRIYNNYLDSGYDWEIEGIFISRQKSGIEKFQNIFVKMNPTQFKDPKAFDFRAFTDKVNDLQLEYGDVIRLKGEWQGRQYHNLIFNPLSIQKTGRKQDPASVSFLYDKNSLLRSHLDAVKPNYQKQGENPQKKQDTLTKN